ncbi:MAG: glycosyltransferase [Magnetococcus sp. DMHC-1]|nr:glycosyltransferase [Magnetococcales bacterium]MBF0154094.1 glycosyltransferase [Magnetococcales bacterium]
MIRVVHLITGLGTGGAERMLHKFLCGSDLAQYHHSVISMTDLGPIGAQIRAELPLDVHTLNMPQGMPHPLGVYRLVRLLRTLRPDILQTWMYHSDLLGLLVGRLAHVPRIVWSLRCSTMQSGGRKLDWTKQILARLSTRPDAILVNSMAGQTYHESLGYRPRRWVRIPNGFDVTEYQPDPGARDRFRQELGLQPETLLVGIVARFNPMKDHDTFLAAAARVHQQCPAAHFVMIGADVHLDNPFFATRIPKLGLTDCIHMTGKRHDIASINAALDVAVSSSIGEGFSNTIGEAMACGVPCVATAVGDSALLIGDSGRTVPAQNPDAMAEALLAILQLAPAERQKLGERARAIILADYALSRVVDQYQAFYQEMVSPSPPTPKTV